MQKHKFSFEVKLKTFNNPVNFELIHQGKIIQNHQLVPKIPKAFEVYLFLFNNGLSIKLNSNSIPISIFSFNKCPVREFNTTQGLFELSLRPSSRSKLSFAIRGKDLDDMDVTSLSDPYFIMTVGKKELYRSEVIMDNLNPVWSPFELDEDVIKEKDTVTFNVWDKDLGSDDFIGVCDISRRDLLSNSIEIPIKNKKKKGDPISGTLLIQVTYVQSLAERLFNTTNLKAAFLLPCHFDYSPYQRILNVFMKSMPTENTLYFGYSSAEKAAWTIGSDCSPAEVLNDSLLRRKNVGPSIAGPGLNLYFRQPHQDSITILIILTFRDLFDPKTISHFKRKAETEQVLIYFLARSGCQLGNLESVPGVKVLKFQENIEEDLIKQFNQISIDLASLI